MLDKNILKQLPEWYKEIDQSKHYMVLSDDMDSYYSCNFLTRKFDLQVGGFYDFNTGLYLNKERTEGKQPIYVDLSISEGMTFDNHYTFIRNPLAINPNVITSVYNRKYNGSTLALLYSLYDNDFSILNERHLTALLYIDGWYIGFYNKSGQYKDINIHWYNQLGCCDYVLPILQKYDRIYFEKFGVQWKLNSKIIINNGKLSSTSNIPLPNVKFELVQPVKKEFVTKNEAKSIYNANENTILISAETYYNNYVINLKGDLKNDNS